MFYKKKGSGSTKNASSAFKIVAVQEQVQADQVHLVRLGKRQSLTNEPCEPLSEGVVKALKVIG
jgi:hypothetical protein